MKTVDFPAGHSMDTDWFAVDKDGNIAVFDSGEDGAVPIEIESQTHRFELFEKYTTPITPGLKQLYLDEKVVENLLQKCNVGTLGQIMEDKFAVDGCILLLNEGMKWEDLNFEKVFAKDGCDFALCLSPKTPLYLISNTYGIREELIKAIRNKVIAKAYNFSTVWDDEDGFEGTGVRDLGIFFYEHDDWCTKPYCKKNTDEIPIKANQFAPNLADKIPYFKDIAFENQYYIQPMEFFSCNSYMSKDEFQNGYVKVTSSDNQEEYCLLPISDQIWNMQGLGACNKCYPEKKSFSLSHSDYKTYKDYPPVLIIEDYHLYQYRKHNRYELLLKTIYNVLNISKKDCFETCCIKCFPDDERENKQKIAFLPLSEKFQNCHHHLNIEISVLHPSLLITIDDTVIKLLKTKYEITGFSETPCLCSIAIEDKQYPLLAVKNVKTDEEQAILTKYLTDKSDEISAILAQPRNLPPPKPRVIRIEEDD
jgi:hypothetical protein